MVRLGCLFVVGLTASTAWAGPHDFFVFATRMGGDATAAQPYIDRFARYLEKQLGWPANSASGVFTTTKADAMSAMDQKAPGFGLIEAPLYFEVKKAKGLTPIAQLESKNLEWKKLHVMVKDEAFKALSDLKGKRVWTLLADFPRYLSRVVLGREGDAQKEFQLKEIHQALRGLRAVLNGEADATLVDDEQMQAAAKLEGGAALRSIYDSPALPPFPVVAFGKALPPAEQKKLVTVLMAMCNDAEGKQICQDMHIDRISDVNQAAFKDAQKRYGNE